MQSLFNDFDRHLSRSASSSGVRLVARQWDNQFNFTSLAIQAKWKKKKFRIETNDSHAHPCTLHSVVQLYFQASKKYIFILKFLYFVFAFQWNLFTVHSKYHRRVYSFILLLASTWQYYHIFFPSVSAFTERIRSNSAYDWDINHINIFVVVVIIVIFFLYCGLYSVFNKMKRNCCLSKQNVQVYFGLCIFVWCWKVENINRMNLSAIK